MSEPSERRGRPHPPPEPASAIRLPARTLLLLSIVLMPLSAAALILSYGLGFFSASMLQTERPIPDLSPPPPPRPHSNLGLTAREEVRQRELERLTRLTWSLRARSDELQHELNEKTEQLIELSGTIEEQRARIVSQNTRLARLESNDIPPRFVAGETSYIPPPAESAGPDQIDLPAGLVARRASAAPETPASLRIELSPRDLRPGDSFTLRVHLSNLSNRSLYLTSLSLIWSYDGRKTGGEVPVKIQQVKPRAAQVVHEVGGVWREAQKAGLVAATLVLQDRAVLSNTLRW